MATSIKDSYWNLELIIVQFYGGEVYVRNPLTGSRELRVYGGKFFVVKEFLRFLAQKTKLSVKVKFDLTDQRANDMLDKRSDVAFSFPAITSEESRDKFKALLVGAGFPEATLVLNKVTSAAVYDVWKHVCRPDVRIGTRAMALHLGYWCLDLGLPCKFSLLLQQWYRLTKIYSWFILPSSCPSPTSCHTGTRWVGSQGRGHGIIVVHS